MDKIIESDPSIQNSTISAEILARRKKITEKHNNHVFSTMSLIAILAFSLRLIQLFFHYSLQRRSLFFQRAFLIEYVVMLVFSIFVYIRLRKKSTSGNILIHVFAVSLILFGIIDFGLELPVTVDYTLFTIVLIGVTLSLSTRRTFYFLVYIFSFLSILLLQLIIKPDSLHFSNLFIQSILLVSAVFIVLQVESLRLRGDVLSLKLEDLNHKLKQSTYKDSLTGIYNRRFLMEYLNKQMNLSRRTESLLSIALIDIDHFKRINDELGHLVGDSVLKEFSVCLKDALRESDFVIRYGGEEFVILLHDANLEAAMLVIKRILARVLDTNFSKTDNRTISFSAGVSQWDFEEDIDAWLKRTDDLLYQAKKTRKTVTG